MHENVCWQDLLQDKSLHYVSIFLLTFANIRIFPKESSLKSYFYSFPTTKLPASALLQYFLFIMYFIVFNCVLKARCVTKWATAADVGAIDCMDGWLLPSCTDCK